MQDEEQRTAAESADSSPIAPTQQDGPAVAEAEMALPEAPAMSENAIQTLSTTVARAARHAELKPGQEPRRQMKVGRVVSDKMDKTVIIAVEYTRPHPLYKKAMKRTSKFAAHDEQNLCKMGDVVRIEETRPLSKTKRWVVREIIKRGVTA